MKAFSIGYIKGSARCTTLMALLGLCCEDDIDLQQDSRFVGSLNQSCAEVQRAIHIEPCSSL
jgi:hypothetical protein